MSEIKALEKLRKSLKDCTNKAGVEPNQFDTYWITANACDMLIDELEAEIADNYMRLPCDADGVPIRVGDELEGDFIVDYVSPHWVLAVGRSAKHKDSCHHVKPRTLEDVLRDYACDFADSNGPDYDEEITRHYADEIRELMKEGGE